MNRKKFLQQAVLTGGSILTVPVAALSQTNSLDPLPPEKVKDFVIAGHGNIDKVKSMLGEIPTLLYATWDWGNVSRKFFTISVLPSMVKTNKLALAPKLIR